MKTLSVITYKPIQYKDTLIWVDDIKEDEPKPIGQDFSNNLIYNVAQAYRYEISNLERFSEFRDEGNISVINRLQ